MSVSTTIEREHYDKLLGRHITGVLWEEIESQALPILLLNGWVRAGNAATVTVLADPECNAPGYLDHNV